MTLTVLNERLRGWHFFFWLGLAVTLVATLLEVSRGRDANYQVYMDATRMMWQGLSPYTDAFVDSHGRYFLYPPAFAVVFAPVFWLPHWLGAFVWNVGNYLLFALSIKTLPERYDRYKRRVFLFLLPVLVQSLFCFQYNVVVCYLFLFAYTLLERGKGHWAVVLIMLSAATKVYGGIELALLLMYPHRWRNVALAVVSGVALLLLPALLPSAGGVMTCYEDMAAILTEHNAAVDYVGILYARGLKWLLLPEAKVVQAVVLLAMAVWYFVSHGRWSDFRFRAHCLALLMGYIILWSDCPETHTYIIALAGWQLAFWLLPVRRRWHWVLFWLLFVSFGILPTDVLCPAWLHVWVHETLWLDVYAYAVAWLMLFFLRF